MLTVEFCSETVHRNLRGVGDNNILRFFGFLKDDFLFFFFCFSLGWLLSDWLLSDWLLGDWLRSDWLEGDWLPSDWLGGD